MEENTAVASEPIKDLSIFRSEVLLEHFPWESMREEQKLALEFIEKSIQANKKYIFIEAPTGVGKSGIAMAIASYAKMLENFEAKKVEKESIRQAAGYVLSPQKILLTQYLNDFSTQGLLELKGKANYRCHNHGTDCDTGAILNNCQNSGDDRKTCPGCPYNLAKNAFVKSKIGVTNFDYFLNETVYVGQLPPRSVVVLDEAHNTEDKILGFCDTNITRKRSNEVKAGAIPKILPGENSKCLKWLLDIFIPACKQFMIGLTQSIESAKYNQDFEEATRVSKQLDSYDKFLCRLHRFVNNDNIDDWLCFTEDAQSEFENKERSLVIKPLTAQLFGEDILFSKGSFFIFLSATFLNFETVIRTLGIPAEQVATLCINSRFPKANRPIYFNPVGSMSYREKQATLPALVREVERIMKKYPNDKGIIHTHSYEITKAILNHLRDTPLYDRLLSHSNALGARDRAVEEHLSTDYPTVLISPSMSEGLDLKEDLSRFQIICKVPYPYLDHYVRARLQRDPAWYTLRTAVALVQATGRSIRSENDKADTYILDSEFASFLRRNRKFLPKWWVESIVL